MKRFQVHPKSLFTALGGTADEENAFIFKKETDLTRFCKFKLKFLNLF